MGLSSGSPFIVRRGATGKHHRRCSRHRHSRQLCRRPGRVGQLSGRSSFRVAAWSGSRDRSRLASQLFARRDGQVRCWGSNEKSANGAAAGAGYSAAPREIVHLQKQAWAVVAGYEHTCAILNDHSLACWGDATDGKLGTGYTSGAYGPIAVMLPGSERVQQVALGTNHSCALLYTRQVTCWGSDDLGQLGNDDPAGDVIQPPAVITLPGGHTATAVTTGDSHTCAILDDGNVTCWGSNQFGQLGNGLPGDRDSPTDIVSLPGGHRALAISAGLYHTCAILDDGTVTCWGRGDNGRLGGGGGVIGGSTVPIPAYGMPGGQRATAISAGYAHTCALLANGGVSCWGLNGDGQLGTGDNAPRYEPSPPLAMPAARAIVTGQLHTCAVLIDDRVTCWGRDDFGQLGNGVGSTDDVLAPPGPIVADLPPYVGAQIVGAGDYHTSRCRSSATSTAGVRTSTAVSGWGPDHPERHPPRPCRRCCRRVGEPMEWHWARVSRPRSSTTSRCHAGASTAVANSAPESPVDRWRLHPRPWRCLEDAASACWWRATCMRARCSAGASWRAGAPTSTGKSATAGVCPERYQRRR